MLPSSGKICEFVIAKIWKFENVRVKTKRGHFLLTALFTNMRILKFKSQLTIAVFAAVNHINGPLRKQTFTLTSSKGQGLWFVINGFRSVLCVSVFQGSLLVIIIMIDGSEKRNCEGGFWTLEFAFLWKAQYEPQLHMAFQCSANLSIPASFCIWRVIHTFLWRFERC